MMISFFFIMNSLLAEVGFLFVIFLLFFIVLMKFFSCFCFSELFICDFFSLTMAQLTVLVFVLLALSGSFEFFKNNNWSLFLILLCFFFSSLFLLFFLNNFLVFFMLFELIIIPIFVMMLGWGYSFSRVQAALYMFFYTFFFSLPLLLFLLYFFLSGFSLFFFQTFFLTTKSFHGGLMSLLMVMVFFSKLPVFALHLWLPKAHVEAPLLGSMILAGVLLKLGGYGLYKCISFLYDFVSFSIPMSCFFLLGSGIISLICLRQADLKSLVAYSSVVHMGPVMVSIFVFSSMGVIGCYFVMYSHGLCSSCLFFLLNLAYHYTGSRSFLLNRGGLFFSPFISFIWFFFCISNMGFPPTFSFFSEIFMIISLYYFSKIFFCFLFIIMLFSGFYSIMLYTFFNHGILKGFFINFFISFKDLLVVFISFLFLVGFSFYLFIFIC